MKLEALRDLEADFWRAPSAHNTQPWVLHYGEDAVGIGWDQSRALPLSDPTGRDLRLSLGAFAECCLIVCASAGIAVGFQPDYRETDQRIGHLFAAPAAYATPFTTADVTGRMSSRVAYQAGSLTGEAIAEVRELAAAEGGEVRVVSCRELAGLLYDADRHQFGTPPVVAELRQWLRLTPRHPDYHHDGLTDRALALSKADAIGLRVVLARAAYPVLRRVGLPTMLAIASRGLLDYEGQVLVLVAPPECGPEGQVAMGRVLVRQWLALSRRGYATHPLSQIIDCPATRDALARSLGVGQPERLVNLVRAGRPDAPTVRSARLRTRDAQV